MLNFDIEIWSDILEQIPRRVEELVTKYFALDYNFHKKLNVGSQCHPLKLHPA